MLTTDRECDAGVVVGVDMRDADDLMAKRVLALEEDCRVLARGLQALDEVNYGADSEDFPEWVVVPIDDDGTGWYIEERYQDAPHGPVSGATILEIHEHDMRAFGLTAQGEARRIADSMNAGMALARRLEGQTISAATAPHAAEEIAALKAENATLRAILASVPAPEEDL